MRHVSRFAGSVVLLLASWASAATQPSLCYAGFDVSKDCITERGLDQKVATFQHKITEAMTRLGASYKFDLRVVNNPVEAGYGDVGDVFTDVVRNEEMRNQSFVINVTADFLDRQPEILFEASALHEVCHVMNDDLPGYHRNSAAAEVAEEHCVLQVVGESRYQQYLEAYAAYQHWDTLMYKNFLQRVKDVSLVSAARESDEADKIAAEYFRKHADGNEHLLVYNGELHDVTLSSTKDRVQHDTEKLKDVIQAGKPMIFFHNHPADAGRAAMFPSYDDFGVAALFSFLVYAQSPNLTAEFRVIQFGKEDSIVSYGFKGTALENIKKIAREYQSAVTRQADVSQIEVTQNLLDRQLAQDAFTDYLQYACPVDLARKDAEVCKTHPQFFLWPSDRFFVHYRPQ